MNFEKIKQAVLKNCGGFENATRQQILDKWNSLPADIQKKYLDERKAGKNDEV